MEGWDHSLKTFVAHHFDDCKYTRCKWKCLKNMKSRAIEAFQLFNQRAAQSSAKNLVVFSHYPTDYLTTVPEFIGALKNNSKHHILYLGGHRHSIDQSSTTSIAPNDNWLVGGGGGWSCDGPSQGFLVAEISVDDKLTTYPVLVDKSACCK